MFKFIEFWIILSTYLFYFLQLVGTFPFLLSLADIFIGIKDSETGIKICVITAGIKNCMSIIKKKKK